LAAGLPISPIYPASEREAYAAHKNLVNSFVFVAFAINDNNNKTLIKFSVRAQNN